MKRKIFAFILVVFVSIAVYGQNEPRNAGSIDLVLLLDTSTGMSSSYDNVNNYITGGFLTEFLRIGDTFHLIVFSQTPRLDIARRVEGRGDVETIIGRMMLQYPIERGSNVSAAISYAEQYVSVLPGRPKRIVLVTTGGSDTANLVTAANQRLSHVNAAFNYVQVTPGQPVSNVPRADRSPQQAGAATDVASAAAASSGANGSTTASTNVTTTVPTNGSTTDSTNVTTGGSTNGSTIDPASGQNLENLESLENLENMEENSTVAAGTQAASSDDITSSDTSSGNSSAQTQITQERTARGSGFSLTKSWPLILGLILLLLLIIGFIILLASRRLGSSPNRVMAEVSDQGTRGGVRERVDHSKDLAKYAAGQSKRKTPYQDKPGTTTPVVINPHGPLLLNLYVEDQNTSIGKRNIHSLKSGYGLSVGGGRGDGFSIFLVPLPANLGELRRSGSQLTFIPKKAKYFPDLGSNELRDCLGKSIRIISDKNYELQFRFEMYEDPLIVLNRMLNSIKVPG